MVRLKQAFPETVQLYVSGPKSILTEPVTADARLSHTWFEFLNGELGLEVVPESGIFVCNARYTPSAPKEGQGWRADLNEEIHEFISKFERNWKQFSVRLCHPSSILAYNYNHSASLIRNGTLGSPPTTNGDHPHAHAPNASGPSTPGPSRVMNITPHVPPDTSHPNQQPNIVISTTGLMGPPPPPQPFPGCGPKMNQNPHYNNANGLSSQQTNRNTQQQQTNKNPQKRKHKQSETLPKTTLRCARGKQRRVDNASTSNNMPPPPPPQSQSRAFRAPNFVGSLSAFKVEPVAESQWHEFWDESSAVNGQDGGEVNSLNMNGGEGADLTSNGDGDHQEDELPSDIEENGAADAEEDDNLSLMTAATAEENELREQEIQVADVKSLAEGRMTRFSNAYMLRVRNEIQNVKKNKMWDKNVSRSPLACYLIQELFRE